MSSGIILRNKDNVAFFDTNDMSTWNFLSAVQAPAGDNITWEVAGAGVVSEFQVLRTFMNRPFGDQHSLAHVVRNVEGTFFAEGGNTATAIIVLGR